MCSCLVIWLIRIVKGRHFIGHFLFWWRGFYRCCMADRRRLTWLNHYGCNWGRISNWLVRQLWVRLDVAHYRFADCKGRRVGRSTHHCFLIVDDFSNDRSMLGYVFFYRSELSPTTFDPLNYLSLELCDLNFLDFVFFQLPVPLRNRIREPKSHE